MLDSDRDGVADVIDKCPSTQPNMSVDSTGCVLDSDKDGVSDTEDKCPGTLPGVKIKPDGCPVDKKQDLTQLKKGINFKLNSAKLTNASYSTLDDIVALLRQIPVAKLEVQATRIIKVREKLNTNLSQKRAEAWLITSLRRESNQSRPCHWLWI
jgi:outer membrane protein OmpA-like peptidoglycan-associated protein